MVLRQLHPKQYLTDIYFRFFISFGYYQYRIRDLNRGDGHYVNNSDEWKKINDIMTLRGNSIKFLWKLQPTPGTKMMAVPRNWPQWYDDFRAPEWNDHF